MRISIMWATIFFLFFLCNAVTQAAPRNTDWLDRKMKELESARTINDITKKIETLADQLGIAGDPPNDNFQKKIYEAVQSDLLAIPEHAIYFKNKLERARLKVKSGKGDSDEQENDILEYRETQGEFGILGSLPSHQSVAVLGFFINDNEGRDGLKVNGKTNTGEDGFDLNCLIAMRQLNRIGIEKPPVDLNKPIYKEIALEYVDKWKNWWNQVKDGNRTYRFIGSPIEYGPDGPASVEVVQRAQRIMKRDEERVAGHKKSFSVGEPTSVIAQIRKPSSIVAIFIAFALIAGAAWYFLIRRRTR
jgi:hypothetical protein